MVAPMPHKTLHVLCSIYLSSLAAAYPQGLPQADLTITTLPASFGTVVDDITERLGAGK